MSTVNASSAHVPLWLVQVTTDANSIHQRALSAPKHWAALSAAMLRQHPSSLPAASAADHLKSVVAACKQVLKPPETPLPWHTKARGSERGQRPLLTPHSAESTASYRDTVWLLRHLQEFARVLPADRTTSDRLTGALQQLSIHWLVGTVIRHQRPAGSGQKGWCSQGVSEACIRV